MSSIGYTKDFCAMMDVNMVISLTAFTSLDVFPSYVSFISLKNFFLVFFFPQIQ